MRSLIVLSFSLLSLRSFALDTSGCSPLPQVEKTAVTAQGNSLRVTALKAPSQACWNVSESSVMVAYQWSQKSLNTDGISVHFWVSINGNERNLDSEIECQDMAQFYEADVRCTATATFVVGNISAWNVEVAPQLSGKWDTRGYGNNYNFMF